MIEDLKELTQKVKISNILIHEKIHFYREGNSIKLKCIFHDDKTPSMSVTDTKGVYHCFGCNASGNIFTLVKHLHPQYSIPEIIKYLKYVGNIKIQTYEKTDFTLIRVKEKAVFRENIINKDEMYYELLEFICKYFQECITENIIETYLTGKNFIEYRICGGKKSMNGYGFKKQTIVDHRIGYSENNSKLYKKIKKAFPSLEYNKYMIDNKFLGMFLYNGICVFKNRIVFPIIVNGRVESFIARQTEYTPRDKHNTGKYRFLSGPREYLFNEIDLNKDNIFIVEGITDCISLLENGYASIALISISIKKSILDRIALKLKGKNIFIVLDTELNGSGEKGANTLKKQLIGYGIKSCIIKLPLEENKNKIDMNSYFLNHTKKEFENLIHSQILNN